MSAPAVITVIAENVTAEARAVAPGEGRRRPVAVDAAALRAWVENFAALPALEAEDADARLLLEVRARRLVVRRAGGRLGSQEGDTFVAATADEIVVQLLAAPGHVAAAGNAAAEASPELAPAARARVCAQAWVLAGLVAVLAMAVWWTTRPETPDGVEWITDTTEAGRILAAASGNYASDNEKLRLDGAVALLTVIDAEEQELLRTTVRTGRRAGATVLVTEAGVLLELADDGRLRIGATDYRRW